MAKKSRRELNLQKYKKFLGNKSEGIVCCVFSLLFTLDFFCILHLLAFAWDGTSQHW